MCLGLPRGRVARAKPARGGARVWARAGAGPVAGHELASLSLAWLGLVRPPGPYTAVVKGPRGGGLGCHSWPGAQKDCHRFLELLYKTVTLSSWGCSVCHPLPVLA